jgi:integrase
MENFTKQELEEILSVALEERELFGLALMVSYHHGLRASELVRITGADVQNGRLRIVRSKQRNNPLVQLQPIHPAEAKLLTKYAAKTSDRLFPWSRQHVSKMLKAHLERLGLYQGARIKSTHSLRHSCGVALYAATQKDIVAVQQWLGHRSIASTQRYVHISPTELAKAAAAL